MSENRDRRKGESKKKNIVKERIRRGGGCWETRMRRRERRSRIRREE